MALGSRKLSIEQARNSYIEWISVHYKLLITQSLLVKVVRQNLQKICGKVVCCYSRENNFSLPAENHISIYSFIYLLSFTERFE